MSFSNVGKVWSANGLQEYLNKITPPKWLTGICIHHTAEPSLKQRPTGYTAQHIENMKYGYVHDRGWSSGPHFYTDDDQVWGMCPPNERGVHAIAFNSNSIGIEVLGDYDTEDPFTGRGAACWTMTVQTIKIIMNWLKLPINESTIRFHREDPRTSKTCPGTRITKKWLLGLINGTAAVPTLVSKPAAAVPVAYVAPTKLPVIEYVVKHRGYKESAAIKLLTNKKGMFFFGTDWLEGASYDSKLGSTVAPISELEHILFAS
jgi:hypothetical protein